jgi:hypothetical protein
MSPKGTEEVGSIPTAPTKSPMFPRVSSLVIPESSNRYYLAAKVLIRTRASALKT